MLTLKFHLLLNKCINYFNDFFIQENLKLFLVKYQHILHKQNNNIFVTNYLDFYFVFNIYDMRFK